MISPFIEKGLKEIEPSDDNEAFLTYTTSFTMKNPEFKGCFDSYCEALTKIKKHSLAILKANYHLNKDSPYPEPFKKLENSYSTITRTIEKPFIEFKEENEMIPAAQFCRKLLPVLQKNRPAFARDVFLKLEAYSSIFGDPLIEDMVKLYKQDKKEESLSKFIVIVTHHEELVLNLPQSIRTIYHHLNSSFTKKHSIELSKNLMDSQEKLPISMQRAYQLAELIAPEVLSHIPEEKDVEGRNEEELVQVLANLGIFCKKESIIAVNYGSICDKSCSLQQQKQGQFLNENSMAVRNQLKKVCAGVSVSCDSYDNEIENRMIRRGDKRFRDVAPRTEPECLEEPECLIMEEEVCAYECDICTCDAEGVEEAVVDDDDDDDIGGTAGGGDDDDGDGDNGGVEEGENEDAGENELNQDQINDAFDLFF